MIKVNFSNGLYTVTINKDDPYLQEYFKEWTRVKIDKDESHPEILEQTKSKLIDAILIEMHSFQQQLMLDMVIDRLTRGLF